MRHAGGTAACALLLVLGARPAVAQVRDTSYTAASGDRILRVEVEIAAPVEQVWKAIATSDGLSSWLAPEVTIDLKTGGSVATRHPSERIGNTGAAAMDVLNYVEREHITFGIHLDDRFSETIREDDDRLQEIVRLVPAGTNTRVLASMVGWGSGRIWDDAYAFFRKRLQDSYIKLAAVLADGR